MMVEKGDTVVLSQVLWMALQAGDHVLNWFALETDLINSREQGELIHQAFLFEDMIDLSRSQWSLKLLSI